MSTDVDELLVRWTRADLIDAATADRIRTFEREQAGSGRLRWPILVALAFGALLIGAGVLLFVAAHWDTLSPGLRFALVLLLVAVFHVAAALLADRFPAMSSALHATGTAALGAGIYLSGQIFHLDEHWPGGLMLWALGAGIAMALLRDAPQMVLLAILAPAWLVGEWEVATGFASSSNSERVVAAGVFLLALAYLSAPTGGASEARRRPLLWLGAIWLLPAAGFLAAAAAGQRQNFRGAELTSTLRTVGWLISLGLPTILAFAFRQTAAWPNLLAVAWVVALVNLRSLAGSTPLYAWWAIGAIGLVAWGMREMRVERINLGAALFAATVIAFYFAQVMDKLGRSMSLVGLGLLFLGGGWALERARRRLVSQVRAQS